MQLFEADYGSWLSIEKFSLECAWAILLALTVGVVASMVEYDRPQKLFMALEKIAVICAHPTGLNPGMLSVDLAVIQFLQSISSGNSIDWRLFNTEAHGSVGYEKWSAISYNLLDHIDCLNEFDVIIFWGDFTHWLFYATKEWVPRIRNMNNTLSESEGFQRWLQLFFLGGRRELLRKTIVFGSTFYGLSAHQLSVEPYFSAMKTLYKNCLLAMPRDTYSTVFINHLVADNKASLGCDCAFLLDQQNFITSFRQSCPISIETDISGKSLPPYAILALGRSEASALLTYFSSLIAKRLGIELLILPWLANNGINGLHKSLTLISSASLVLTDIYHCAVSSLREEKPTIVFGSSLLNPDHSLSDNKKEVLMRQHLLGSNYISTELVHKSMATDKLVSILVDQIIEIVKNQKAVEIASLLLNSHVKRSRDVLKSAIINVAESN